MTNIMTTNRSFLALFVALIAVATPHADSQYVGGVPHKKVVDLGPTTFPNAMKDVANPFWLLKFYAPW